MRISIRATAHKDGTRAIYKGDTLIGTISNEKPTRSNNRAARYGVAWSTGRFDWFDTYAEARDQALKGASMKSEYEANLSLQPMDRKPCRPGAIEHYRPGGEWVAVRWCVGVIAGGALIGFIAGLVSAYL